VTAALFFASIVAHELSHAVVARSRGLPVRSITLYALGGVTQIEGRAGDAKTELWMAATGPITSVVIGLICLALTWALGGNLTMIPQAPVKAMFWWLGYINIGLGVFNLVPGFPLDGGRVLRAVVWWATGDPGRATHIAVRAGQVAAFGFIALGLFRFFDGAGLTALWFAFIGWFLFDAANSAYARSEINEKLKGLRAGDVMEPDCPAVDGRAKLQTFVDDHLLRAGHRCYAVVEKDHIVGIITLDEARSVDRSNWPYTTVRDAMRPLDLVHTVTPETPVAEAWEAMGREKVGQLPVVSGGRVEGIISLDHILQILRSRRIATAGEWQ
jgi:Zn-dependent protease